jgi:predicted metalloendopeptidase
MTRLNALLGLVLVGLTGCRADSGAANPKATGSAGSTKTAAHDIDRASMDTSVAPGDDFYRYANGTWLKNTEIPADRASYGIFDILAEQSQRRTKDLLEAAASGNAPAGSDERKAGDYFATYMDEATIEKRGLTPLEPTLKAIAAINDRRSLARWIGQSLRADVDPLNATNFYTDHVFGFWFAQDLNDPSRQIPYMLQGGLGVPDRDYYIEAGKEMDRVRAAYRTHLVNVLTLAGMSDPAATAPRIYDFEHKIANVHWTRTQSADVAKANNHWTRADFDKKAPGIDWTALFDAAGLSSAQTFIVWQPDAVIGISKLVASQPVPMWREYLAFHAVDHNLGILPKAFADEGFEFYGKALTGTTKQRDRWKRAVDATNGALGQAVGRMYVQKFFPPEAKTRLKDIIASISTAFEHRIDALSWMSPKTKASAKAKVASLVVGIGYPDTWRDYSPLQIVRGEAFENAQRASLADYEYQRSKLTRPPDRNEWWMDPQTVNALNLPVQNALNFPAAILVPPYFDPAAPAANNYGAIGAIIGHEISHSFDDTGSQFDATGRFVNWWTPEDLAHFKAASNTLIAQYDAYRPFPDVHVNGKLTLGENIADLAGLGAAYDAYRAQGNATLDTDRSFFISYGQAWKAKRREALVRQLIVVDGHAPDEYRADTIRNIDAWYSAFDVRPGLRLYLEPADRVRVW